MGIKGLKKLIRKYVPESIQPFQLSELYGKTVAVDSSILLYKFRYTFTESNFHIIGFVHKILEFRTLGVNPIFVFDGVPPEAKKNVLSQRSENRNKMKHRLIFLEESLLSCSKTNVDEFIDSDSDSAEETAEVKKIKQLNSEIKKIKKNLLYVHKIHSTEVMELLKSLGIPFFESFGEAEETCAILQKRGVVDYILTEDTDSLAFGGSNIIFNTRNGYEIIRLPDVLMGLALTMDSFIDLCILCGCDYTATIPKVGPINGYNHILNYESIENVPVEIPDTFDYRLARQLFKQNNDYPEINIIRSDQKDIPELTRILLKNNISEFLIKF
jgi:flap endonuclease-1